MIRMILLAGLLLLTVTCEQAGFKPQGPKPDPIRKLVDDFVSADWTKVEAAKSELESVQAESIPVLMELLDRDERVELKNTMDLIYPGAEKFQGHGWFLDYDIDWISVRAGWALEDLTFQNFGFREGDIKYAAEMKKLKRAEAVSRAKTWWQADRQSWNRFKSATRCAAQRRCNPSTFDIGLDTIR